MTASAACRAYAATRSYLAEVATELGLELERAQLDAMAADLVARVMPALAPELVLHQELAGHGARRTGGLRW